MDGVHTNHKESHCGYRCSGRDTRCLFPGDHTCRSRSSGEWGASLPSVVGIAETPDGKGYWLGSALGDVFSVGDAGFYGSISDGNWE
jgi:hypothetical protein